MDNRYFITEVHVPAGTRTLERSLAAIAREYTDCVMSEAALKRLKARIELDQVELCRKNGRLKAVPVRLELNETRAYCLPTFNIGQVGVFLRRVKGELI